MAERLGDVIRHQIINKMGALPGAASLCRKAYLAKTRTLLFLLLKGMLSSKDVFVNTRERPLSRII